MTDSDHEEANEFSGEDIEIKFEKSPEINHKCQDGVGYLWMQNIKLNWNKYCDYDAVLQLDSDCVVHSFLCPHFYRKDKKWKWWVRDWSISELAIVHKKPLAKLLGKDSLYEHMPYPGWIMERTTTEDFHRWIKEKHGCDWWQYLVDKTADDWGNEIDEPDLKGTSRGSSIYNAYGGFVESNRSKYIFIEGFNDPPPIRQHWSHGGIDEKTRTKLEDLLN